MPTQCLASTGSNLLAVLGIGFVLAVIGFFLLRSAKGRAAVMVLVLVGGGLLFSQATSKPASAACVASSATTMPAPTTTSTTSTTSSTTTTTTTAPAAGFTFKFNFQPNGIDEWNLYSCSNFTATIKVTGVPGAGTTLVNANSSFPTTMFQSVPASVTASTSYTVTYGWSCNSGPSNLFSWAGTGTTNIPGPVSLGTLNAGGGNWSQSATFTTGTSVSAGTGVQIDFTAIPVPV